MGLSRHNKRLYLTLAWKSESLVTKIVKPSMHTKWSQKRIWSFTVADFLYFDFFPFKSETLECSATLTLKCRHVSL